MERYTADSDSNPPPAGEPVCVSNSLLLIDARFGADCESDLYSLDLFNRQTVAGPVVDPRRGRTFVPGDLLGYFDSPT